MILINIPRSHLHRLLTVGCGIRFLLQIIPFFLLFLWIVYRSRECHIHQVYASVAWFIVTYIFIAFSPLSFLFTVFRHNNERHLPSFKNSQEKIYVFDKHEKIRMPGQGFSALSCSLMRSFKGAKWYYNNLHLTRKIASDYWNYESSWSYQNERNDERFAFNFTAHHFFSPSRTLKSLFLREKQNKALTSRFALMIFMIHKSPMADGKTDPLCE